MQITTLGALAVDGRPVRGDRLVALIAGLLGARGRAVSSAALVEDVWEGIPPDDAAGAVQALVSRARRLGFAIEAAPGGYRLPTDGLRIDVVEAEALLAGGRDALRSGDAARARDLGRDARGLLPAVPDLGDPATARLLADVVTLQAEAGLTLGHVEDMVEDLRRCALRTPPDEPLVALLVRVLAAQGRDAEALEVVEQVRAELADRYGTDPSPVVADAHLALLRGELAAAAPAPHVATVRSVVTMPAAWRRPATALVGRDDAVAQVEAGLSTSALVTVVATGGAGKTRLAGEVARRAAAAGGSVRVVELAGLRSPDEVLPTVLAAIGGSDATAARADISTDRRLLTPQDRLRLAAQDLDGLLVLDNCEHVLAAAAVVVGDLLAVASPDVVVLATSRAPLGLVGELVHRLRALPDSDALALLEARARAGRAGLAWNPARALELCHHLDNLPLALELAAARLRAMTVQDVLDGLGDRFGLLDDALRGLPDRHASLWAMVDWSRELLHPEDRDLLQRLAVVPAPFTAETAVAVSGADPASVRRGLSTLVEQSLLTFDEDDAGLARYRMLETVREYGDVRLDGAGERAGAMGGLVRWAATTAARVGADFVGAGQLAAFDRCAAEQETFLAALRWAVDHGDEVGAVDIASALFHLWSIRGLHVECVQWGMRLLHADDPAARRASTLFQGSATGRALPDAGRATTACVFTAVNAGVATSQRPVALALRAVRRVRADRPHEVSPRVSALAEALPALGSPDLTVSLGAAERMIATDDDFLQGLGLFMRAAVRENSGDASISGDDAREAYRRFQAIGDHWGMGVAAQGIGQWEVARGGSDAERWLVESLDQLELVGAMQDVRSLRVQLDLQRALAGDTAALDQLHEVTASTQVDDVDAAQAHLGLAQVASKDGRRQDAIDHAESAASLITPARIPMPQPRVVLLVAIAVVHLRVAALPGTHSAASEARAVELLSVAGADAVGSTDIPVLGTYALGCAELAASRGQADRARELWALGTRLGANLVMFFQLDLGSLAAEALGDEATRQELLDRWRALPPAQAAARVRELTADAG
ncbi:BTAD domain-containing putative transcriptional regulator [Cellulomonas sp. Leaf395]|uniref:BTAD domain-containing putative transcriptional regulator n=1 Tax=Cellulomonas sp. Leaf395 TaxID=1736362 RepID=UPI0006F21CF2|nr:BTAD domain-containing putative transcriptional regulator [Cellulomonas sp. Leaf395]KQS98703.1 transcriptional regulator [Cellulomonas sp. Leaf395]